MKALTADQVEDVQMALRDIQSQCDKFGQDVRVLRMEYPTPFDKEHSEHISHYISTIQEKLDQIRSILK